MTRQRVELNARALKKNDCTVFTYVRIWKCGVCAVPMARVRDIRSGAASREKYEMSSEPRAAIFGFVSFFAEAEMSVCVRVVE